MDAEFLLKNLWRWKCGMEELEPSKLPALKILKETEWSEEFEMLMRNRLIMGAIRYGRMRVNGKPKYDRVKSMIKRLIKYQKTGNKEFLVDVANLSLLEFEESDHPNQHFRSIDDGEHVSQLSKPVCPICRDTGYCTYGGSFGGATMTQLCSCGR